jgi:ribosomal protein S18 acetylase RimI-like enzyme
MKELMRRHRRRGEGTFLHVMSANDVAKRLYEGLGFRTAAEVTVRIIERI